MVLGKVMAAVSALAIVLSPLLPGLSARAVSQENQETLTSGDMVQATIDQDFGKVTSQVNFDYELLMGNAEGTLSPFIAAETGIPVQVARNPLDCAALGAGYLASNLELLSRIGKNHPLTE